MAETTLLFRPGPLSIDDITLDAVVSETHTHSLQVTEHPVESGADITDHARVKPDVVTLDIVLSDIPTKGDPKAGRAAELYEKLRLLMDNAALVTVVTSLRVYESMILESLSAPKTVKESGGVRCTASLRQIRVVQNKTSVVTVTREPITKKIISRGKQAAKEAPDAAQKYQSTLKATSDSTGFSQKIGVP